MSDVASLKQLVATGRPTTALFAFLLTVIGFRCFPEVPWFLTVSTALVFALITASIMSYNDFVDRHHDRQKGKTFASEHTQELRQYLWWQGALIGLLLMLIGCFSVSVAAFCVAVWIVGMLYSHVHERWYWFNNLVVAVCSGAPALCGYVYHGRLELRSTLLFGIFLSLILLREVYKDIEDMEVDRGYKRTLPLEAGLGKTALYLLLLTYVPVLLFMLYPSWVVKGVVVIIALMQPFHLFMIFKPQRILKAKKLMDVAIQATLVLVLMTR